MIDLNEFVKLGDRFYNADGTPANFGVGRERTVRNFIGAPYQQMIDQGWYLYVASVVPSTHKAGAVVLVDNYSTRETVPLTQSEIAVKVEQEALAALTATDDEMSRTDEDIITALQSIGVAIPSATIERFTNKKAKRSAYLAVRGQSSA